MCSQLRSATQHYIKLCSVGLELCYIDLFIYYLVKTIFINITLYALHRNCVCVILRRVKPLRWTLASSCCFPRQTVPCTTEATSFWSIWITRALDQMMSQPIFHPPDRKSHNHSEEFYSSLRKAGNKGCQIGNQRIVVSQTSLSVVNIFHT